MIKAVIFDMDGLIIETEHIHSQSYEQVLRNRGVEPEFNEDGVIQKVGLTAKDSMTLLRKKHNLKEDADTLVEEKQKFYIKLLKENLQPKEGLLSLVEMLKKKKLKTAVASSSSTEHIQLVLKGLHIIEYFDAIVSGENVKRGKPHPDIFLEAAKNYK
jgi:HAD superfamily hydrolase (TIGR01509 family)